MKSETSTMVVQSKLSSSSIEFEDGEVQDEFYDAIGDSSSSSEDEESEGVADKKVIRFCFASLKNGSVHLPCEKEFKFVAVLVDSCKPHY